MRTLTRPANLRVLMAIAAVVAASAPHGTVDAKTNSKVSCELTGSAFVAFGNYNPGDVSPLDAQGRVSYRCFPISEGRVASVSPPQSSPPVAEQQKKVKIQISLSAGLAQGSFNRFMSGPTSRLYYNVYLDAARQSVWGDGTAGTEVYEIKAQDDNHEVVVPVYGRIFSQQDVDASLYWDNLTVTLDF